MAAAVVGAAATERNSSFARILASDGLGRPGLAERERPRYVKKRMFQRLGPAGWTRVKLRVSRRFNWCSPHQSVRRLIRSPLMA